MCVAVALLIFAQSKAGPLDAFRANYAAVKCDIDFGYSAGHYETAVGAKGARSPHGCPCLGTSSSPRTRRSPVDGHATGLLNTSTSARRTT